MNEKPHYPISCENCDLFEKRDTYIQFFGNRIDGLCHFEPNLIGVRIDWWCSHFELKEEYAEKLREWGRLNPPASPQPDTEA